MSRAASQIDSSRHVFDEKQNIQRLEGESFHRQKIARQKLFFVVIEKCAPGAPLPGPFGSWWNTMSEEHRANRGRAGWPAQFAQFPLQFAIPQTGIVPCYADNPLLQFRINGWTSGLTLPYRCPMPADYCGWLKLSHTILQRWARMTGFLFQPHRYGRHRPPDSQ